MYSRKFYNKNLRGVSRELRNQMTFSEKKLWQQFLRTLRPRVHRQRPLGNFIVDFYIPKAKLVIEIDGEIHDDLKHSAKDLDRTIILNKAEIMVIRFTNKEILFGFQGVCDSISRIVHSRTCEK